MKKVVHELNTLFDDNGEDLLPVLCAELQVDVNAPWLAGLYFGLDRKKPVVNKHVRRPTHTVLSLVDSRFVWEWYRRVEDRFGEANEAVRLFYTTEKKMPGETIGEVWKAATKQKLKDARAAASSSTVGAGKRLDSTQGTCLLFLKILFSSLYSSTTTNLLPFYFIFKSSWLYFCARS